MTLARQVGRSMLSSVFLAGGVDVLARPESRAQLASPVIARLTGMVPVLPKDPVTLVRANAAAQVAAGALLALGRMPRLAALALAGSLVPTTLAGHRFWDVDEPGQRAQQRTQFLKNAAILGGLLLVVTDRAGCSRTAAATTG